MSDEIYKAIALKYTTEVDEKKERLIKATAVMCDKMGLKPVDENGKVNFPYNKVMAQHKAVLLDFAVASHLTEEPSSIEAVEETPQE